MVSAAVCLQGKEGLYDIVIQFERFQDSHVHTQRHTDTHGYIHMHEDQLHKRFDPQTHIPLIRKIKVL